MGVFGIIGDGRENVASSVYYGLYALQHRGQESCGIVVNDDGVFNMKRDTGLVNDVFSHGILLCGGGALLGGLSKIIAGITGVDAYVFPNSSDAVALGMSEALKVLPKKITQSIKNISRFCLKSLGGYNI